MEKQILQGASQSDLGSTWYPGDLRFEDYGGKEGDDEHRSSVGADGKVSTGQILFIIQVTVKLLVTVLRVSVLA